MKKNVLNTIITIGIASAMIAGLAGCGSSAGSSAASTSSAAASAGTGTEETAEGVSASTEPLNVAVVSVTSRGAVPALAEKLGYYEEEGLDVTMQHLNGIPEMISALISKKTDVITFAAYPELQSIAEGEDLSFIAATGNSDNRLYALHDNVAEYSDIRNLDGKKIGIGANQNDLRANILPYFKEAGIDTLDNIEFVEFGDVPSILQAISKGAVDAGFITNDLKDSAEKLGVETLPFDLTSKICCRNTVRTEDLTDKESALTKYLIANLRSYSFIQQNHEEAIKEVAEYSQTDEDIIANSLYQDGYLEIDPNRKGIEEAYEYNHELGYLDEIQDIDAHINTDLYYRALQILEQREPDNEVYQQLEAQYQEQDA